MQYKSIHSKVCFHAWPPGLLSITELYVDEQPLILIFDWVQHGQLVTTYIYHSIKFIPPRFYPILDPPDMGVKTWEILDSWNTQIKP